MGFALSYLFIEDNFLTKTKPKVEKMIDNIRRSFNTIVNHLSWMDWTTKESTLKKSQKMKSLIGEKSFFNERYDDLKTCLVYHARVSGMGR